MPGSVRNFKQPSKPFQGNLETVNSEGHHDVNLYVTGLPPQISPVALGNLFETCGRVTRVKLLPFNSDEFSTRAGFVCYATFEEAEKARIQLKGCNLMGYTISIQYPHSRQPHNAGDSKYHHKDLLSKLEQGPLSDHDASLLFNTSQDKSNPQDKPFYNNSNFDSKRNQQRSFSNPNSGGHGIGLNQPQGYRNNSEDREERMKESQFFQSNSGGRGKETNQSQHFRNNSLGRGKIKNQQRSFKSDFAGFSDGIKQQQGLKNYSEEFGEDISQTKTFKNFSGGHGDGLPQSHSFKKNSKGRGNALRQTQGFLNTSDRHEDEMKRQHGVKKYFNNAKHQTNTFDKSGNDFASSRSNSRPPCGNFRNDQCQNKSFQNPVRENFDNDQRFDATTQQGQNDVEHYTNNPAKLSHSPCRICGKMTQSFCSLCSFVHYCSEECQSKDWPEHSKVCKTLAKNDKDMDSTVEQHDVANRRFNSGNTTRSFSKPPFVSQQKNNSPPAFISQQRKSRSTSKSPKQPLIPKKRAQIARIPPNVKSGAEFDVIVTDLDADNAALICQIADKERILSLSRQQDELNAYFTSNSAKVLTSPTIGDIGAAKFSEDNMWYRAEVKNVLHDDKVQVRFIDYGNSEVISKSQLKQLAETFCNDPAYCLICKLAQTGGEKWIPEQLEFLGEVLQQNEMLLHAECLKTTGDIIYAYFSGGETDVNEKMIEFVVKPLEKGNRVDLKPVDKPSAELSPIKAVFTPVREEIHMPLEQKAEQSEATTENEDTPRIYELGDISSLKLPLDGFDVLISYIDNPNSFYCQVIGDDLMKLHRFLQRLTEHCQASEQPNNVRFKNGNICCALFEEDQMWYRAQIVDVLSENSIKVFYFDFGNSAEVSLDNVRVLPEDFMNLPIQAFKASMADCFPLKDGKWHNDAIESFKSVLSSPLKAKVIAKNSGMPQVLLFVDENRTINEQMISEGFATKSSLQTSADNESFRALKNPTNEMKSFIPEMNKNLKINVTCINEGGVFHCHVVRPELEALFDNISELTLYANREPQSLPEKPCKGTVCAAYFDEEQTWYRGVVENVEGTDMRVRYVDYGNTSRLTENDVKLLRDEFQRLPIQAVSCVLAYVRPVSGTEWDKDYNEAVSGYVGKELDAKFIGKVGSNYMVVVPDLLTALIVNHKIGQHCL